MLRKCFHFLLIVNNLDLYVFLQERFYEQYFDILDVQCNSRIYILKLINMITLFSSVCNCIYLNGGSRAFQTKMSWSKTKLKAKLKVYLEVVFFLKIFRVVGISEVLYNCCTRLNQ